MTMPPAAAPPLTPTPNNKKRLALVLGLVAGVVAATGLCVAGPHVLRSNPSSTAKPALAPAKVGTTGPARTTTATLSRTTPAARTITGFGATIADWNSVHPKDPTVADAYNPGAFTYAGATVDRFIDVRTSNTGRVVAFTEQMPPGTRITTARYEAFAELPPDAFTIWLWDTGTCEQLVLHSKSLADVLVQAHLPNNMGVDSSGFVLIVSQGADPSASVYPYPPEVITMKFSLGGMFPLPDDIPRC